MLVAGLLAAAVGLPSVASAADVAEDTGSIVMGVGLVIGLAGTGDSAVDEALVGNSVVGLLKQAGLNIWQGQIAPGRVAKVMVTAELPANAEHGTPVAISVTAIGDAASLAGGTLLATPLRDLDGTAQAMGQGRIATGERVAAVAALSAQSPTGRRDVAMAEGIVVDAGAVRESAVE